MFISVVIPVYNVERYIENCLKALFAQDYTKDKYEVICVDNNSLDTSRDIIKRFPHVILISETNQGAYAARNLGIEKARGEIIAFTDPDCIPEINWLSKIVDAMRPVETMIVLGARYADSDSYLLSLADAYENTKKDFVFGCDTKELYFGYTNNMAVRSKLFKEVGLFAEIMRGADTVFVNKVVNKFSCSTARYSPEVIVLHMEMKSIMDYYRKQFIFARSSKRCTQISTNRPLNFNENLTIFRKTVHLKGFKYYKSISLLLLLVVGKVSWVFGRLSVQ